MTALQGTSGIRHLVMTVVLWRTTYSKKMLVVLHLTLVGRSSFSYVPDVIYFAFAYHTDTKLNVLWIFNQTRQPRRVDAWPRYGCVSAKCLFQRLNYPLLSSGMEPKSTIFELSTCFLIH